jgi:hypothetical protein
MKIDVRKRLQMLRRNKLKDELSEMGECRDGLEAQRRPGSHLNERYLTSVTERLSVFVTPLSTWYEQNQTYTPVSCCLSERQRVCTSSGPRSEWFA